MKTLSIILALIVFFLTLYFSWSKEILREKDATSPYSFAKFQLMLWMLVIIPAFCLYWGFNDDPPSLNKTALLLLGISTASTLTSEIVKSTQEKQAEDDKAKGIAPRSLKAKKPTSGFWADILSDDEMNLSITRLQNLLFTFIFIVMYVSIFFSDMGELPEFDDNAFILMGISSGSYVLGRAVYK